MRILLDEMMSSKLARHLAGHEVSTVQRAGWTGLTNGALLDVIDFHYDVFITMDRGMRHQQHRTGRPFAIIEVRAPRTAIRALLPALPRILATIDTIRPGEIVTISVAEDAGAPGMALDSPADEPTEERT